MAFTYLHLYWQKRTPDSLGSEGVVIEIKNNGNLTSLGGPNSRSSLDPFAVFKVERFEGLEAISTDDLWTVLFGRHTTKELMQRIGQQFTDQELIQMLQDRLRQPDMYGR